MTVPDGPNPPFLIGFGLPDRKPQPELTIILEEDTGNLDEVVAVGLLFGKESPTPPVRCRMSR